MHLLFAPQYGWYRRAACLLIATSGFAVLYFLASLFIGDYGFAGLSDDVVRKVGHFTVYGSLAWLIAKAIGNRYALAWLIAATLATIEEVHQIWIRYRVADVADWSMNIIGISTFIIAAIYIEPIVRRKLQAMLIRHATV